jgi:hypothetical protein
LFLCLGTRLGASIGAAHRRVSSAGGGGRPETRGATAVRGVPARRREGAGGIRYGEGRAGSRVERAAGDRGRWAIDRSGTAGCSGGVVAGVGILAAEGPSHPLSLSSYHFKEAFI